VIYPTNKFIGNSAVEVSKVMFVYCCWCAKAVVLFHQERDLALEHTFSTCWRTSIQKYFG